MITRQSTEKIRIERTIYDPVTAQFILSKYRPLENVREWITGVDRSAYWYILCIHNDSNTTIDEWGIVLETSSGLSVLDVGIEGVDLSRTIHASQTKPWLARWTLGLPHELGIVIPRGGSKRVYFKLGSDACGVEYTITGKFTSPDVTALIKNKKYVHSCDVPTLKTAMLKNPEQAFQFTQNILAQSYNRETALKLLTSFRLLQDIKRCCEINRYEEMLDKLQILSKSLENAHVKRELLDGLESTIDAIKILDRGEASSERGVRLCNSLVDEWIQDVLQEADSNQEAYKDSKIRNGSFEPEKSQQKQTEVTHQAKIRQKDDVSLSDSSNAKKFLPIGQAILILGVIIVLIFLSSFNTPSDKESSQEITQNTPVTSMPTNIIPTTITTVTTSLAARCNMFDSWDWSSANVVYTVYEGGRVKAIDAQGIIYFGTWVQEDYDSYVWYWNHGLGLGQPNYIDTLSVSADCNTLNVVNNYGTHFTCTRI